MVLESRSPLTVAGAVEASVSRIGPPSSFPFQSQCVDAFDHRMDHACLKVRRLVKCETVVAGFDNVMFDGNPSPHFAGVALDPAAGVFHGKWRAGHDMSAGIRAMT